MKNLIVLVSNTQVGIFFANVRADMEIGVKPAGQRDRFWRLRVLKKKIEFVCFSVFAYAGM